MKNMTLEQMDHFLRHIEMHAEEFRHGNFTKSSDYLKKLKIAQKLALDLSHDIIHVMRIKQFKGYETADFCYDVSLPKDIKHHEFRHFDASSFIIGCKLKATIDLGIIPEQLIVLSVEEAEEQMNNLGWAIQDAGVLIKMLEEHFGMPQTIYENMSFEQMDHFIRHIKIHAEELRNGEFVKNIDYLKRLKVAQYKLKDLAHDLFHVMREKGIEGYKNNDFNPYVSLPKDYMNHTFRTFDYESFRLAIQIKYLMNLGMVMERDFPISIEDGQNQMNVLYDALEDAEVFLQMLDEHFHQNK